MPLFSLVALVLRVGSGSRARYYPCGGWRTEPTASDPNGSPLTDRGFTGHMHNNLGNAPEDIGLVYMAARWYSPTLGRFISADTIVPDPANPQSYNRYSYVRNRVLNATDPTGHRDLALDQGGGGGVDIRLPLLSKGEAEKALKSIGQTAVTTASFIPGVGDAIDVYDFMAALYRGEYGEAGFVLAAAALPGSARAARNVGGEIVEFASKHSPTGFIDPSKVRFSQNSVSYRFRDGGTIDELVEGLQNGTVNPNNVPPIRLVQSDDLLYTLDNRRLEAFRRAEAPIPYRMATAEEAANEVWKFTTRNEGVSIRIRGEAR